MNKLPPEGRPESRPERFFGNNWLFFLATLLLVIGNLYLLSTSQQGDALVAINGTRNDTLDVVFLIGTRFAEPVAYAAVALLVSAFSYRKAVFALVAGASAGIVAGIFKVIFAQARPMRWFYDNYNETWHSLNRFEEALQSWDTASSFPSGHTASAFALYGFLAFNARAGKLPVTIFCLALAAMVGFSRMYLLYHFLRDVTAGAFIGLLMAMVAYYSQARTISSKIPLDRGWLEKVRL